MNLSELGKSKSLFYNFSQILINYNDSKGNFLEFKIVFFYNPCLDNTLTELLHK